MDSLKRACLWLLTMKAWLDTAAPLKEREALKAKLDAVLFWYRDAMSKRWMHEAGVEQLRDWESAWHSRSRVFSTRTQQDLSVVFVFLKRLEELSGAPKESGLRTPQARGCMKALLQGLTQYQQQLLKVEGEPEVNMNPQDELEIYFQRVAEAVR